MGWMPWRVARPTRRGIRTEVLMSREPKTSLSSWKVNACLLAAFLGTVGHFALVASSSRSLKRGNPPIGPLMDVRVRVPIAELWESNGFERTAVLFLDVACEACQASLPFYSEVDRVVAETPGTRLVVLSENPIPAVRMWLNEGGVGGRVVRIPSRMALGVLATPTLLLANSEGVVTDISIGILDRADSARFMARLRGDVEAKPLLLPYSFTEASVSAHPDAEAGALLVDTRDRVDFRREHSPQAINIPEDELAVRAPIELSTSQGIFIDCRYDDQAQCRLAGGRLVRLGFTKVIVLMR